MSVEYLRGTENHGPWRSVLYVQTRNLEFGKLLHRKWKCLLRVGRKVVVYCSIVLVCLAREVRTLFVGPQRCVSFQRDEKLLHIRTTQVLLCDASPLSLSQS